MIDIRRLVLSAPEEDADFAPVHEDEALALVRHVRSHAAPHDAVPGRQVHLIEFRLDDLSDVVENAALLEGESDTVNCVLLHIEVHVCVLDHCVLSLLLVGAPVRLHHLSVRLALPSLRLCSSRVCYNLRYCRSHFLLPLYLINFKFCLFF